MKDLLQYILNLKTKASIIGPAYYIWKQSII